MPAISRWVCSFPRYGLYRGKEHTQREIAGKLGISRSYVSRIEKKAIEKIRTEFAKHG